MFPVVFLTVGPA